MSIITHYYHQSWQFYVPLLSCIASVNSVKDLEQFQCDKVLYVIYTCWMRNISTFPQMSENSGLEPQFFCNTHNKMIMIWVFVSLSTVPGAPPRRVEVEALNSTALKVMWRSLTPGKQHGQIRGYQVHYVRVENGESRGLPLIKDVMLADAQVWPSHSFFTINQLCQEEKCIFHQICPGLPFSLFFSHNTEKLHQLSSLK